MKVRPGTHCGGGKPVKHPGLSSRRAEQGSQGKEWGQWRGPPSGCQIWGEVSPIGFGGEPVSRLGRMVLPQASLQAVRPQVYGREGNE